MRALLFFITVCAILLTYSTFHWFSMYQKSMDCNLVLIEILEQEVINHQCTIEDLEEKYRIIKLKYKNN